jgi:hypothetical protein
MEPEWIRNAQSVKKPTLRSIVRKNIAAIPVPRKPTRQNRVL